MIGVLVQLELRVVQGHQEQVVQDSTQYKIRLSQEYLLLMELRMELSHNQG